MSSVMVASSIGPGKEYAIEILKKGLAQLQLSTGFTIVADRVPYPKCLLTVEGKDELTYLTPITIKHKGTDGWSIVENIAHVREVIRTDMLRYDYPNFTHLFFLDADVLCPPDTIERLLKHEAPIATGIYPVRDFASMALPAMRNSDCGYVYGAPYVTGITETVEGFGMGCMLIMRNVLEKTKFRQGPELDHLGEDYGFCLDSGEKVLVDPSISCWHVHSNGVAGRFLSEEAKPGIVWEGFPGSISNRYGRWNRGIPRYDLSSEDALELAESGKGFRLGTFTPVRVELSTQAAILSAQ